MKCEICGQEECKGNVDEVLKVKINTKTDNWRQEFDKEEYYCLKRSNLNKYIVKLTNVNTELKNFIQQLLDEQKKEIVEMIEEIEKTMVTQNVPGVAEKLLLTAKIINNLK